MLPTLFKTGAVDNPCIPCAWYLHFRETLCPAPQGHADDCTVLNRTNLTLAQYDKAPGPLIYESTFIHWIKSTEISECSCRASNTVAARVGLGKHMCSPSCQTFGC